MLYKTKPRFFDAYLVDDINRKFMPGWVEEALADGRIEFDMNGNIIVNTSSGKKPMRYDSYIVKEEKTGNIYVLPREIFLRDFERDRND